MRLFQAQVLDEFLEGDGASGEPAHSWGLLLARAESLKVTCIVDTVVASPTLTVTLLGGISDVTYFEATKSPIVPATGLGTGTTVLTGTYSGLDAGFPPPRHLTLNAVINGAGGKAHVRMWVCGRGPQLLEALPPSQATLPAQLDMARRLADEGRLPLKKRVLSPGASVFYPPDLWLPSLRWER